MHSQLLDLMRRSIYWWRWGERERQRQIEREREEEEREREEKRERERERKRMRLSIDIIKVVCMQTHTTQVHTHTCNHTKSHEPMHWAYAAANTLALMNDVSGISPILKSLSLIPKCENLVLESGMRPHSTNCAPS